MSSDRKTNFEDNIYYVIKRLILKIILYRMRLYFIIKMKLHNTNYNFLVYDIIDKGL